ncbi:beta strand repeat-containing protein [Thiobacillus denitrificans]|uniref:DUF11 domain-containing protein n=1 Tax=Thiobacillus denitrificans TaxID=36861 RepID=A0A119CYG8_THIDE|nr:DUF11 domain-containing protein [Thiobacillus denitrificans]KVW99769.1 hypothetical protein ABW22_00050 [Thiobacillus denitrificans]
MTTVTTARASIAVARHKSAWLAFPFLLLAAAIWLFASGPAWADTPAAGTRIGNQASATYTDNANVTRTVTSNTVTTVVQQVAALTLTANGAKYVTPGGQVAYPHTLTNTGNGADSYTLATGNSGDFSFAGVTLYADADGDGVPDNTTPVTSTGTLAAGAEFRFVAVGTVPASATSGASNALVLTASSVFAASATASNTDTTTVTTNAVINVTKAMDQASGPSPSGPRTITLTYTNSGNVAASNLTLMDVLPAGMLYVPNSARWSAAGGTVLSDADNTDSQGGIVYDWNVTQSGRVTAVIAAVAAGSSGRLSFQVNIASDLASGANPATANTASYAYNNGSADVAPGNTNTVQFSVSRSNGVTLSGDTVASATQGGTVAFANVVTNTGNGTDSFDITVGTNSFPPGTTFVLYQADGATPLIDSNGNGTPDTGPLAAGASTTVVLKAILPPGATGGPYTVQKTATSAADPNVSATTTDTLSAIVGNSVDLTNNAAGPSAPGAGVGPEGSAVVTNRADPGSTSRFTLHVNNTSSVSDSFSLAASGDGSFATQALPAGWSVTFRDASGAVITDTGIIDGGGSKLVYADVKIPAGQAPGTTDIFFRVLSPNSGAGDRIHDAVTVNTVRGLSLTPNHSGQIQAGGSVVYAHTLSNGGNVREGADASASQTAFTVASSGDGFSAALYWDKNGDGILDAADPLVTKLADINGGSGSGLAPGETATLFVKVYAPSGAPPGAGDKTTLTATTSGVIDGVDAPAAVTVDDNTTVIAGQVRLVKEQAVDAACDGAPDAAYAATSPADGAAPGSCVRYRITATNAGVADVTDVTISDSTPAYTTYSATTPAAVSQGSVTAPADGTAGKVEALLGTLTPGQAATLSFGVRINP